MLEEALAANALRNIEKTGVAISFHSIPTSLKKNYHCEICKKDFHTKPSLRQHLTTKTHLILAANSGISLNSHILGISTNGEIADSKRKVRPISNHDLIGISKDKNIQTQIIHDSINPPHHHIEIIAIKDMLPKSPAPVLQDRNLYKENSEIKNKQNFIQNDPLHKNCKNCQKCTSSAISNGHTEPFMLSLDEPLCIEIKEDYFKDFEAQKAHEQVNNTIDFITSEDKKHIHSDSSLVFEQGNKAQKFPKASGRQDFFDSAKKVNSPNTATNIDHPSNLENINDITYITTKASDKHQDSIHEEVNEINYPLPYGWKKYCRKRGNNASKDWNVYVTSPDGKLLRSSFEIVKYLSENPKVNCDKTVVNTDQPCNLENIRYVATKTSIQDSDNSEKLTDFNSIQGQESVKVKNVFSFEDSIVQSAKTEAQDSDTSEKVKNVDSITRNKNEKTDGDLSVKSSSKIDHDCPAKYGEICNLCATKFAQKYDMN